MDATNRQVNAKDAGILSPESLAKISTPVATPRFRPQIRFVGRSRRHYLLGFTFFADPVG
jgi:hypothetical protein